MPDVYLGANSRLSWPSGRTGLTANLVYEGALSPGSLSTKNIWLGMKNPPQGWCPWRVPLESLYFVFISIKTHKSLGFGNLPWYDFISILYPIGGAVVKNLPADAGDTRDMNLIPGLGRFPWRRKWQPTLVFLPGKFHRQRSLLGYSPWVWEESDMT